MKKKPKTYWIAKTVDNHFDHATLAETRDGVFERCGMFPWSVNFEKQQNWKIVKVKLVEVK